jgi:geranylgeranyl reductase family protein
MTSISIIGAGPIGSYTAQLLSKKGFQVNLIEEHKEIGTPIQCTGILTSSIKKVLKLKKDLILNKLNNIEVVAPNKTSISFNLKEEEFIIDRQKFDHYIYNKAIDGETTPYLNHRYMNMKGNNITIRDLKNKKIKNIKTDILIGADGPLSQVAKTSGLFNNRKFLLGIQASINKKHDPSTYKTFFGKNFPNFFGWFVPESKDIARVGLAAHNNSKFHFENFIKKFKGKIIEKQAGLIPIHNSKIKTQKNNTFLVGDAACQTKNTTGGGIIPGLICSKALTSSITNNLDYEKEWRKKIGSQLFIHKKIRETLDNFSDKDYNYLIKLLSNKKTKRVIESNSRESPSKLISHLLLTEPKLLLFMKNLKLF